MDISTIYEITAGRGGEIEIVEIRQSLQKVLEKYETSKTNIATIVSDFKKEIEKLEE